MLTGVLLWLVVGGVLALLRVRQLERRRGVVECPNPAVFAAMCVLWPLLVISLWEDRS